MSEDDIGSMPPAGGVFGLSAMAAEAAVVLLAVPWGATTSKGRGTARGPAAILEASCQVDLFDVELGPIWRAGIAMLPPDGELARRAAEAEEAARRVIEVFDAGRPSAECAGDRARVDELGAWMTAWVQGEVERWLARGKLVGVVGGDHSVALGSIAAHAARHPGMGVLQIDAHADLRVAYQGFVSSHASVMHRVMSELGAVGKLVSVGVRDLCAEEHRAIVGSEGRIAAFFDADVAARLLDGERFATVAKQVAAELPAEVYVSFDIDGLDPALCPNTGTPVPGGLGFHQAMAVLGAIAHSGRRIVGFDLCEVAPGPAGRDGRGARGNDDDWDANVGARVLYKLVGHALASRA